jgi:hypothetical protein
MPAMKRFGFMELTVWLTVLGIRQHVCEPTQESGGTL